MFLRAIRRSIARYSVSSYFSVKDSSRHRHLLLAQRSKHLHRTDAIFHLLEGIENKLRNPGLHSPTIPEGGP